MTPTRSKGLASVFASPVLVVLIGASSALFGVCGPFTDVAADAFCPFVLEIFYLGITTGTSPTTYDPASNVNRIQMAAFIARTVDEALERGSRRAALGQFWTPQNETVLAKTDVADDAGAVLITGSGASFYVANGGNNTVSSVRASDGKLLETWTGAILPFGVLGAMGRIFVTGNIPGTLYMIDPAQPAGAVTPVALNLPNNADGITFDGGRVWTANFGPPPSISIITPGATIPWTVTTVTAGFAGPLGTLYDGANVWITDTLAGTVLKLNAQGAILQTVTVGSSPAFPVFDGANIWIPINGLDSVSVVRASSGAVLATLTGNGLDGPKTAAFDGQRVLVTNYSGDSVSLFKAANLAALGSFPTGSGSRPYGAASDGLNFWISLNGTGKLARF